MVIDGGADAGLSGTRHQGPKLFGDCRNRNARSAASSATRMILGLDPLADREVARDLLGVEALRAEFERDAAAMGLLARRIVSASVDRSSGLLSAYWMTVEA